MKHRDLRGASVVITGASSGIGKAAALEFARRGADVVLAARRDEPLDETAEDCRRLGVRALAVPTDVRLAESVGDLARQAIREFGKIDVWVNNAGVFVMGPFDGVPYDVGRQAIETDLFGTINGILAVLPHFRERRQGTIINIGSIAGKVALPQLGWYNAAKFAVSGLSESLRMELRNEPDIHISAILPASIDTPLYQHMANYTGRAMRPMRPYYPPELVAEAIADAAESPVRERIVGGAGKAMLVLRRLFPAVAENLLAAQWEMDTLKDELRPNTSGAVMRARPGEWTSAGGRWQESEGLIPGGGRAVNLAGAAVLALGAGWILWRALRGRREEQLAGGRPPSWVPPRIPVETHGRIFHPGRRPGAHRPEAPLHAQVWHSPAETDLQAPPGSY